jgi:hypothetical protein
MATSTDFPAHGKVLSVSNGGVVFAPANSTYQMQLATSEPYTGAIGKPIAAILRGKARKIYTVPSGGGFVSPIFGPPKIVQGWALYVDDRTVVIRGGVPFVIELPGSDDAVDLSEGAIAVGKMLNAVVFPGATFEVLTVATAGR